MDWSPQDESTFRDRIVRIEKRQTGWFGRNRTGRRRARGADRITLRLPFSSILVMAACLIGIKAMVLANSSEGAYRAAALEMASRGTAGQVLAVIFGPDPISTQLARHLRF